MLESLLQKKWLLIDDETWEELILRNSKRWLFLAAKNYPKVKIAKNIPKEMWDELNILMTQDQDNSD